MDFQEVSKISNKHEQALEMAEGRKGQQPLNKPDRQQLEEMMKASSEPTLTGYRIRFMDDAYAPSRNPLSRLEMVQLGDLRMETHHLGKVLIVTVLNDTSQFPPVQCIVQDGAGNVDRLVVYCDSPSDELQLILSKGQILAIKEPFYKAMLDSGYAIHVDHPSDLIHLRPMNSRIPTSLATHLTESSSPEVWQERGNSAYVKKDYLGALDMYTNGIEVGPTGMLMHDLHRNRAIVNIFLKQYKRAEADARKAIIPTSANVDDQANEKNVQALFSAARAAYEVGKFGQARQDLAAAYEISPENHALLQELQRTTFRCDEESNGSIDFELVSSSIRAGKRRVDCASFSKNIEVRDAGERGRGAFAKVDIKAGGLILFEKAFDVVFATEGTKDPICIMNMNTYCMTRGAQIDLLFSVMQRLCHDSEAAGRFLDLYDKEYGPKGTLEEIDGMNAIDVFRVQSILEANSFDCPSGLPADGAMADIRNREPKLDSSGMWITMSYVNHACVGNACHSFMGDLMILRASRDITRGEEITYSYRPLTPDMEEQSQVFQAAYGFECDCALCTAEAKVSTHGREQRKGLLSKIRAFIAANEYCGYAATDGRTVERGRELSRQMADTYDTQIHGSLPRLGLVDIGVWLCLATSHWPDPRVSINNAVSLLHALGFGVTVEGEAVVIDRRYCIVCREAILAAAYMSRGYSLLGQELVTKQLKQFAEEMYLTRYGEERGFEAYYSSL